MRCSTLLCIFLLSTTLVFATDIDSCQTLSSSDTYVLNASVQSDASCFSIGASNLLLDCNGHTITFGNAGGGATRAISGGSGRTNVTIQNCIIEKTNTSGAESWAISVSVSNSTITNNSIRTHGQYENHGIRIDGNYNLVEGNIIVTNGTGGSNFGLYLGTASYNRLQNNNITTDGGSGSDAVYFTPGSLYHDNSFVNNSFLTLPSFSTGLYIRQENTTVQSNTFSTTRYDIWIRDYDGTHLIDQPDATMEINNANVKISRKGLGSVAFSEKITEIIGNLSSVVDISYNEIFVDTETEPGLNVSAQVRLEGLPYLDPRPLIDIDDDGTYTFCEDCTIVSYSNGTFVYDVAHFTTYSSQEVPPVPEFSTIALLAGLIIILSGFVVMRT
ncbi:hypothetical protein GF342_02225 [Candidatus Woesearchaeota archaeon]|nr:hypothetical protein [Candidatus Woesearchaeota archaeon]